MTHGRPLRVVLAPDSFKGSIAAAAAVDAFSAGWRSVRPGDALIPHPMADGGEGTLETVAAAVAGATRVPVRVTGPDDRPVDAAWLRLPDGTALVELAATSGLLLLQTDPRDGSAVLRPRGAHTLGTGQAIRAAVDAGASRVHVALGGSASSDGGAGIMRALGVRLLDDAGAPILLGNVGLDRLAVLDRSELTPLPHGGIVAWTDVRSPLLGPAGAVAVFGPQKGLAGAEAAAAERALARLAGRIAADPEWPPVDPEMPGAGAAGGAGFGLAALGATLRSGAEAVAEVTGLDGAIADADLVVTGEGSFDAQSAQGKVVSLVAEAARRHRVPVALVAGRIAAPTGDFVRAVALAGLAGPGRDPIREAAALLRSAGAELASRAGAH